MQISILGSKRPQTLLFRFLHSRPSCGIIMDCHRLLPALPLLLLRQCCPGLLLVLAVVAAAAAPPPCQAPRMCER
jgi:hypothetical protein